MNANDYCNKVGIVTWNHIIVYKILEVRNIWKHIRIPKIIIIIIIIIFVVDKHCE